MLNFYHTLRRLTLIIVGKKSLGHETKRFKQWACTLPGHYGEWEQDYPGWKTFYQAAFDFLKKDHAQWSKSDIDDILYAIARDNEGEVILEQIAENTSLIVFLANHAARGDEMDAKWQFAVALGKLPETHRAEAEKLLLTLADDTDEYVSRMSILALGKIKSEHAEALAERAWESGHEYQRIAALWVLSDVSSTKLSDFLGLAIQDGRQSLIHNVEEIKHLHLSSAKN